jgi:hypothetical protein
MEQVPLNLTSTIEELLGRNSSGSCLKYQEDVRVDPLRWPHDALFPQNLELTSPTTGGVLVGMVAKAKEFSFSFSFSFSFYRIYFITSSKSNFKA